MSYRNDITTALNIKTGANNLNTELQQLLKRFNNKS